MSGGTGDVGDLTCFGAFGALVSGGALERGRESGGAGEFDGIDGIEGECSDLYAFEREGTRAALCCGLLIDEPAVVWGFVTTAMPLNRGQVK